MEDFLGFNIYKSDSDTYHLSQPKLINQIVSDLLLSKYNATPRNTPSLNTDIMGKYQDADNFYQQFHCCSVIGNTNYSEKST